MDDFFARTVRYCDIELRKALTYLWSTPEAIFDTFTRLNSKSHYEGTGWDCRFVRIVEKHGGSITAFGNENAGSKFVIRLPERQRKSVRTKATVNCLQKDGRTKRSDKGALIAAWLPGNQMDCKYCGGQYDRQAPT